MNKGGIGIYTIDTTATIYSRLRKDQPGEGRMSAFVLPDNGTTELSDISYNILQEYCKSYFVGQRCLQTGGQSVNLGIFFAKSQNQRTISGIQTVHLLAHLLLPLLSGGTRISERIYTDEHGNFVIVFNKEVDHQFASQGLPFLWHSLTRFLSGQTNVFPVKEAAQKRIDGALKSLYHPKS